ncbi:hypothetical protein DOTSEDRAFT_24257 [Dothistroma septosporum NZE10]|uniref:GCN5-related N-acetyltransferase Rv2170-like domain-containing protein n=1 Tax=Dothistroma septosporum (strain NZE10 / CBS 128990) TaxID=675120 RepID=N1PLG7_DOTSN|nr:hypothetical protein DOTSEDRAFT_24257 [Dothistroma septosporum NZE10]
MASTKMHAYPISSPSDPVVVRARQILRQNLSLSLPLYRRLQFGRFFEATTLVSNLYALNPDIVLENPESDEWLIAFVDRTCRPETEVWMFASWEAASSPVVSDDQISLQDQLLKQLINTIKTLSAPQSLHRETVDQAAAQQNHDSHNDDDVDFSGTSRSEYAAHMADSNVMLFGAIHERTVPMLERCGYIRPDIKTGMVPNHMYTFTVDALPTTVPTTLPQDLRWGSLQQQQHFALVRSRTQIPRQDRTLAVLPNVAIFTGEGDGVPVAWAFAQLDGSLSTLHVEPEWRGRGLAKAVMVKLFKEKMDMFWEEGVERVAHDYVIKGNGASVGVSKSLGGESAWEVFWCRVDLNGVGN